jgi:hypothetical protein
MGNLNRHIVVGVLLLTLLAMRVPPRGAINPKEFRGSPHDLESSLDAAESNVV